MEIKAKSRLDLESMRALMRLCMFGRGNPKKRMIFWTVAFIILFAIVILEMFAFGYDGLLFVLIGVDVLIYLLLCYWYFWLPKIRYNSLAKMKDAENEYIFKDDKVEAVTKTEEYNGESEIKYSLLIKAMETSKYFFLFQNNSQVFMVDKSTIAGGTAEDIRNKLASFVGNKYIICKY